MPIISDVKRGSIAHRCGMIQTGDHLLSIDMHSLRGKNLHEIVSLLKTADDVVRLRIKKDDNYSEDNLCENNVVYKVQLLRQGYVERARELARAFHRCSCRGPLGLTISGSEDVFEPIIVSDLCEGGLADKYVRRRRSSRIGSLARCRTNAIHVGDRILAINDFNLRGKGLNEAIKLLQTSGDEITLKISRTVHQQQSRSQPLRLASSLTFVHDLEDYTPSVDSAMESWDSSNTDHRLGDANELINKDILSHEHPPYAHSNGSE